MNIALTLAISLASAQFVSITRKLYSDKYGDYAPSHNIIVAVSSLVAGIVLFFWSGGITVSTYTFWLSIVFGIVTALSTVFHMKAIAIGPLSYTTVIVSMSTFMSALSGTLFWDEKITFLQVIGMLLMVGCILCSTELKNSNNSKKSFKWILYCAAAFVTCGGIGIMQKMHQSSPYKDELDGFLVISFVFGIIFTGVCALMDIRKEQNKAPLKKIFSPMPILWFLICGGCTAINHKLNLFLSGKIDSAVFFPTVNGGGLVLTAICAMVFFKEKLTGKQWLGMLCGVASVLLLCNYS